MLKITSRENQRLKRARMVRDGRVGELIFVEGLRLAEEALRSDSAIEEIFFTVKLTESERGKTLVENCAARGAAFSEVAENVFASLADTKNSQGAVLIARRPETGVQKIEARFSGRTPLVVVLHRISVPSNLGSILRTAEAADAAGVVITRESADAFSPKALRGSMGAAFRLPLWTNADFREVLQWAKKKELISVAANVRAQKSYTEIDWSRPRLLIFGSEAHGLDREEIVRTDENLKIPMANGVESLNLAASAAVILFEARRQNTCRTAIASE